MTPGRVAEQAVLGALLLEPDRFGDVRDWLQASDFDGTAERQAYEAMRALVDRRTALSAAAVDHELRSTPGRAAALADGAFLADCMAACPSPRRAAVYGRMVLELSIRRRIAEQGIGLRQQARTAMTSDSFNRVFFRIDSVRRDVEQLHLRESRAAGVKSPTLLLAEQQAPSPGPVSAEDAAVERTAVRALVHRPSALDTVGEWLAESDFGDVECATLYREMGTMRSKSQPNAGVGNEVLQPPAQQPRPQGVRLIFREHRPIEDLGDGPLVVLLQALQPLHHAIGCVQRQRFGVAVTEPSRPKQHVEIERAVSVLMGDHNSVDPGPGA